MSERHSPMMPVIECVTCGMLCNEREEWHWLDSNQREAEHDACYRIRFARQFPAAEKLERER